MNILVLGGTRFLGKALVQAAIHNGHHVTLFNRGNHPDAFPEIEQIHDDRDRDCSKLSGRTWDAIIDTSGLLPWSVEQSARLLKDSGHYTFVSSCSVYKDPSNTGINEQSEVLYLSTAEIEEIRKTISSPEYMEYYGHFKALSELAVEKEMPGRTLSIRAGQIVGPYDYTDRLPYWIKRIAEAGDVLAPGRRNRQVQIIDSRDLAEWMIRLIEKNVTGVFNAVGPKSPLTMEQLLNEINTVTSGGANFIWAEEEFLNQHQVEPWGEMPLWVPEEFPLPNQEKPWRGFFSVNHQKAIEHGLTFRSIDEILNGVYEWEQTRGNYEPKSGMDRIREKELLQAYRSKQLNG